ncbi:MAG: nucleotidyltransferase family protein [Vulcanisaeta sp.]
MVRALILAGGFGKRLQPLTLDRPKPLIEIGGKPILQWQIEWLSRQGIKDIVLAVGYLRTKVFEVMGDGSKFGVRLFYSVEEEPLGTGGAIKNAMKFLEDEVFIVLNGDIITNLSIKPLIEQLSSDIISTIALVPMRSPYGIVHVDHNGFITEFREKPLLDYLINAGVYAFTKDIFRYLPDKGDIEVTAFPKLASEKRIRGVIYRDVYWKSVDTVKDVEEVERVIKEVYA